MTVNEVIVAREKHGTFTYQSALTLLRIRINEGYWYDGPVHQQALAAFEGGEQAAWEFLRSRRDAEYEYVERQVVQR